MEKNYLSVVYNERRTPKTDYPGKLAEYLMKRFGLKKGELLLEIGCGRGDFLKAFRASGLDCSGVDMEKRSKELLSPLQIKQCDISKEPLPFDDGVFDIVYHKSLIEHLHNPVNLMSETMRVLKDGGKLIMLTPDWESQYRNFYEDPTHHKPYTKTAIEDILKMSGFKYIVVEKFYQLPVLWRYPAMSFLSRIIGVLLPVKQARWLTEKTGIKYFRFSTELMVLGFGER